MNETASAATARRSEFRRTRFAGLARAHRAPGLLMALTPAYCPPVSERYQWPTREPALAGASHGVDPRVLPASPALWGSQGGNARHVLAALLPQIDGAGTDE